MLTAVYNDQAVGATLLVKDRLPDHQSLWVGFGQQALDQDRLEPEESI